MANSSHHSRHRLLDDTAFVIMAPLRHQVAPISGATIAVTINDHNNNHTYEATLFFLPFDPEGTNTLDGNTITISSTTGYSVRMPVDFTNGDAGRVIQVDDLDSDDSQRYAFTIAPGSGSGSSGSRITKVFKAKFCKPGQLVPVALTLKLDSKVTRGTCAKCSELNRPALLLHSDEAKLAVCWYSRPIAFCGKKAPEGYWVLERNSATAWTLVLKQGDTVVVEFTAKTKPKDCSLPIKLQRKGAGSRLCKDWPKTVSISPAS
jgi:hypothetical protein